MRIAMVRSRRSKTALMRPVHVCGLHRQYLVSGLAVGGQLLSTIVLTAITLTSSVLHTSIGIMTSYALPRLFETVGLRRDEQQPACWRPDRTAIHRPEPQRMMKCC